MSELLTAAFGLLAPERSLRDEAVACAGSPPEGVSSKVAVPLRRSMRSDVAAARVMRELIAVMDAVMPGTLADTDPEFLHDYRVSLRRARAILRELRSAFDPALLPHVRAELRWLQLQTAQARDMDVYVTDFECLRALAPEQHQAALTPLLTVLQRRRLIAHRTLVGTLRSERADAALAAWSQLLDVAESGATESGATAIGARASKRIRTLYRRMVARGRAIGPGSAPEDYHALRKQGKELRYLLELFGAPLHDPEVVRPMVKALKRLQDVLGRYQDREVQIAMIGELSEAVAALPGGAGALMAMGVLVERLEADSARARGEFKKVFAAFASDEQRRLVRTTFA